MSTNGLSAIHHFHIDTDADGIAWLTFRDTHSAVNRLHTEALDELETVLGVLERETPRGVVIQSGHPGYFIAGANVPEFASILASGNAQAVIEKGLRLFDRLDQLPCPTVALVHGRCLGGGLELALACRIIIATDDPATRFALPEVLLGILPGWGGMHRLPRRIGAPAALDLMLSGRSVSAQQAGRLGLCDAVTAQRVARLAATQAVLDPARLAPRRARGPGAWLNHPSLKPLLVQVVRRKINQQDPYGHYPAPRQILDFWRRHDGHPLADPPALNRLLAHATTRNLLRVFELQERLKSLGRTAPAGQVIRHVHVVGAGVMGGDIAAWCALKGLRVTLQDAGVEQIGHALGRARALYARKLKTAPAIQAAWDRLVPDPHGHGVGRADLVIEAISENIDAKQALYAALEPRLAPHALLATNTSSLTLDDLSRSLAQPERLIGLHFFNPVARMPLVEVVTGAHTPASTHAAALRFVHQIGKLPLPVRSVPGFLVNAALAPYMLEAMRCLDEGNPRDTIDESLRAFGMPMGPLELVDIVGLDVARAVGRQLASESSLPRCLESALAKGHLGRKSGQGFYRWNKGRPDKQRRRPAPVPLLAQRILAPLVQAVRAAVSNGVVGDPDLADAGLIFGAGFAPFRGGPLHDDNPRK
ncbi:MAG: 3-hydroxyacyl-CoA dehydrogenase NAD-binding domain-containing protein [Burkholderiaceae bacterium]